MAPRSLVFVLLASLALSSLLGVALANDDQAYVCQSPNRCMRRSDRDNSKCWSKDYCYYECGDKEQGMQCDPDHQPSWCDKSRDNHSCQDQKHCFYNCPDDKPHCKAAYCYDPSKDDRKCDSKNYCYKN